MNRRLEHDREILKLKMISVLSFYFSRPEHAQVFGSRKAKKTKIFIIFCKLLDTGPQPPQNPPIRRTFETARRPPCHSRLLVRHDLITYTLFFLFYTIQNTSINVRLIHLREQKKVTYIVQRK